MNTTIFCFSGTGNSYYVANSMAQGLGATAPVMLPTVMDGQEVPITERMGIVFPTYKGFPPSQVIEFIRDVLAKQDLSSMQYLFLITTCYLSSAYSLLATELTLQDIGCLASYVNHVKMVDTYVPLFTIPPQEKIDRLYAKADRKIEGIVRELEQERFRLSWKKPFGKFLSRHMMHVIHNDARQFARQYTVSDACIGCGLCYRICPTNNITMHDGKPVFHTSCTGCLGCYHRCPTQAIVLGHSARKGHYRNEQSGYTLEYRKQ